MNPTDQHTNNKKVEEPSFLEPIILFPNSHSLGVILLQTIAKTVSLNSLCRMFPLFLFYFVKDLFIY